MDAYKQTGLPGTCVYIPPVGSEVRTKVPKHEARRVLGVGPGEVVFLMYGVGHGGKDWRTVVEAFQAVLQRTPGDAGKAVRLIIAGKSTAQNDALALVEEFALRDAVMVIDRFLTEEEVRSCFSASDALVLSYRPSFVVDSGVLMDSVSYRLPMIASDCGAIGEFVTKFGVGVTYRAGDNRCLARRMLEVTEWLDEDWVRVAGGLEAAARAHSWSGVAMSHIRLYHALSADGEGGA